MEGAVLDLDRLRAVRVLGRGAMGTVFLVVDKRCASAKPDALRRARWELSLLSAFSSQSDGRNHHPFLPSLLGSVDTPDLLAWALPYCSGGDLHALRRSLSPDDDAFSIAAIRFYLSEIIAALAHLHSLRIAYRDLKPENVLLQSSGHITLTDFDLSRYLPSRSSANLSPQDHLKKNARSARVSPLSRRRTSSTSTSGGGDERSFSFVGTEEYVAPEVVRGDGHGFAVDWWALGILAYEMAYGRTPFRGRNRKETFRNVLTRPPQFSGQRRTVLTDLIERLLAKDPTQRLGHARGADEVKAHPFFEGVMWELLPEVSRPPFLAPVVDGEEGVGFDVRDYLRGVHQQQPAASPSASSESLAES
ncbi:Protein tyrosine kinase [Musa troglodytarum]|uniref:non-specific serine/threonine protein kinase n=1 Tax=Musa troglodytarum TaxID=320322 RepID=A0A9E7GSH8_9LILI|nr:Protein tyrosine kinase [Musa troglodytarum]